MSFVIAPRSKKEVDGMIADLDRVKRRILKSKTSAREFLIKGGFITKAGKLTKRYGG